MSHTPNIPFDLFVNLLSIKACMPLIIICKFDKNICYGTKLTVFSDLRICKTRKSDTIPSYYTI